MKKKKLLFAILALVLGTTMLVACNGDKVETTGEAGGEATSDTTENAGGDTVDLTEYSSAELEEGALYRICVNNEETFEKDAMTVSDFSMVDNSIVKLEIYGRHLSQIWRAHKNSDGTYS